MAFGHFLLGSHNFMATTLGSCVKWPSTKGSTTCLINIFYRNLHQAYLLELGHDANFGRPWNIIHDMASRNPCRLYIHDNFWAFRLSPSGVKWTRMVSAFSTNVDRPCGAKWAKWGSALNQLSHYVLLVLLFLTYMQLFKVCSPSMRFSNSLYNCGHWIEPIIVSCG